MTLLILTLWLLITLFTAFFAYNIGRKAPKNTKLSLEEKRMLEKERRELENFWNYNGDSQEVFYGK